MELRHDEPAVFTTSMGSSPEHKDVEVSAFFSEMRLGRCAFEKAE
jgi:hypothetical protein